MRAKDFIYGSEKIQEAPIPADWDISKIETNKSSQEEKTFSDRLKYAVSKAQELGSGAGRVAFDIEYKGRPTVLKIARNKFGLEQNKDEVRILKKAQQHNIGMTIPLIDYDKKNKEPIWVQTELAKVINDDALSNILGAPDLEFFVNAQGERTREDQPDWDTIYKAYKERSPNKTKADWDRFKKHLAKFHALEKATEIEIYDLARATQWGIYKGEPVLIDLGVA